MRNTDKEVVATLVRAGRRDLARAYLGDLKGKIKAATAKKSRVGSKRRVMAAADPYSEVNKFVQGVVRAKGLGDWELVGTPKMNYKREDPRHNTQDVFAQVRFHFQKDGVNKHVFMVVTTMEKPPGPQNRFSTEYRFGLSDSFKTGGWGPYMGADEKYQARLGEQMLKSTALMAALSKMLNGQVPGNFKKD